MACDRLKHGWHEHGHNGIPAVCTLHAVISAAASALPTLVPPFFGICRNATRHPLSLLLLLPTSGDRWHFLHKRGVMDKHNFCCWVPEVVGQWQSDASGRREAAASADIYI
jgi:hypothetical protein